MTIRLVFAAIAAVLLPSTPAFAQDQPMSPGHQHPAPPSDQPGATWQFMQDGIVYALLNYQGGPRGGTELIAPNWWMGMWSRPLADGQHPGDALALDVDHRHRVDRAQGDEGTFRRRGGRCGKARQEAHRKARNAQRNTSRLTHAPAG